MTIDAQVGGLADRFWESYLELDPLTATEIGDDRFDGRLDDVSAAGRDKAMRVYSDALDDACRMERDGLREEDHLTIELIEFAGRRGVAHLSSNLDRLRAASHIHGPAAILPSVSSRQRVTDRAGLDRYVQRLQAMPAYVGGWVEVMREGVEAKQTSPRLVVDRTIGQLERLLALDPARSPGMAPVAESAPAAKDRVLEVLRETVWPAHAEFLDALRDYRAHATETIGLHSLPDGEAVYRAAILGYTTLDLDPAEIAAEGRARVAEACAEQQRTAEELGFSSARDAIDGLRTSDRWAASTPAELVSFSETLVQRGWEAAGQILGRLPKSECRVEAIDPYREHDAGSAYYVGPAPDGSRPGVYYVNTSRLEDRPLYQLAATAYHEANPGHHLQRSIEIEQSGLHPLRRYGGILAGDSYVEGWALYAERLADELGLYSDGYQRLGMLEAQAVRACRLVVDTGIHAFGWTRDQAIDAMIELGMTRTWAEADVDRYIALPGQALAYTIGYARVRRWREEAERREGRDFSLSSFHDRLLSLGTLPLETLENALTRA